MNCPKCNSRAVRNGRNRWWHGQQEQSYRCTGCGHVFGQHQEQKEKP